MNILVTAYTFLVYSFISYVENIKQFVFIVLLYLISHHITINIIVTLLARCAININNTNLVLYPSS